jgi:hypothetical protein
MFLFSQQYTIARKMVVSFIDVTVNASAIEIHTNENIVSAMSVYDFKLVILA